MPILQASASSAEEAAYGSMLTAVWGAREDEWRGRTQLRLGWGIPFFGGVEATKSSKCHKISWDDLGAAVCVFGGTFFLF